MVAEAGVDHPGDVLIGAARVYFVWKARQDPGIVARRGAEQKPLTQDELAVVMQYYFASFDQAKQLEGKTVWIKAGYSLPLLPLLGRASPVRQTCRRIAIRRKAFDYQADQGRGAGQGR